MLMPLPPCYADVAADYAADAEIVMPPRRFERAAICRRHAVIFFFYFRCYDAICRRCRCRATFDDADAAATMF